ncbi:MAG: phenylalanine--tRNA ligase subunit alpha, partial [Candidatus Zixiibacteriota bacterium]
MSLLDEVSRLESEALERIGQAYSLDSVKELQIRYLGRKGPLVALLRQLGSLPEEERRLVGARA